MKSFKQINAEIIELTRQVQGNSTSSSTVRLNLDDILADLKETVNTSSHNENEDFIEVQASLFTLSEIYTQCGDTENPSKIALCFEQLNEKSSERIALKDNEEEKEDLEESTIETTVQKIDELIKKLLALTQSNGKLIPALNKVEELAQQHDVILHNPLSSESITILSNAITQKISNTVDSALLEKINNVSLLSYAAFDYVLHQVNELSDPYVPDRKIDPKRKLAFSEEATRKAFDLIRANDKLTLGGTYTREFTHLENLIKKLNEHLFFIETNNQSVSLLSDDEKINRWLSLGDMYNRLAQAYIPLLTLPDYAKIQKNYIEAAKNACERCLDFYQEASDLIAECTMTIRLPSLALSNVLFHSDTSLDQVIKLIQKLDTLTSSSEVCFEMDNDVLDTLIRQYPANPEIKTPLPEMLQRIQKNIINVSTQSSLHIDQHIELQKAAPVAAPPQAKTSWWLRPLSFTFCPPSCSTNAVNENAHKLTR